MLPDHLHAIWALPQGDDDHLARWNLIKGNFSRCLPASFTCSASKVAKREKGVWQRRYWQHQIRDDGDLEAHVKYTCFNPVCHGLVERIADWPHSSFHRDVKRGLWKVDNAATAAVIDKKLPAERFGE